MDKDLTDYLFRTKALKIADPDQPFWYTSGKIGPFFINTHYLYGSEEEASLLLEEIEKLAREPEVLPVEITSICLAQYKRSPIYRYVLDMAVEMLKDLAAEIDFISGGERRDFFFSLPLAKLLEKPHLTCYKNGRSFYSEVGKKASEVFSAQDSPLKGKKGIHLADIVTVASSFFRLWLPQIERVGAKLSYAAAILDRGQGGKDLLAGAGIPLLVLGTTNEEFFKEAVDAGQMDKRQADYCLAFLSDPDRYMEDFFNSNPKFIATEISKGGKNKDRALLALEMGYTKS